MSPFHSAQGAMREAGYSAPFLQRATRPDRLTLDVMLAVLPPLLQLLPVIIQSLQTHDAILKTGSAGTQPPEPSLSRALFPPTGPTSHTRHNRSKPTALAHRGPQLPHALPAAQGLHMIHHPQSTSHSQYPFPLSKCFS
jgi:hypothetical protein